MRSRPLTPRAICVPGSGLRITRDRRRHHVDKGAGDLVDFRADAGAEKRGRGEVERELLHRGIEQHRPRLRLPLRDPRRDPGIEFSEIGFHRPGLEGDRERAPVQAMLFEIEQHQPARKQQAENRSPAMGRGEQLGLVEQHQFVGLGPEQRDAGLAEHVAAIDQAVFRGCRSTCPLGSASTSSVLPMNGQPSSPGIWVSELRFGGVKVTRAKPQFASTWQLLRQVPAYPWSTA